MRDRSLAAGVRAPNKEVPILDSLLKDIQRAHDKNYTEVRHEIRAAAQRRPLPPQAPQPAGSVPSGAKYPALHGGRRPRRALLGDVG